MNNGFTVENLMRVLPTPLDRDSGMHELGQTTAEALVKLWLNLHMPRLYTRIDELPESLLDILAKDFKVDWYNYNHSIETKRNVIKDSFFIHRHLGTKAAFARALSDVYPNSTAQEWYEYGGNPFYFRIIVDAAKQREPIVLTDLHRTIDLYKPMRARMEGDTVIVHITCGIVINTGQDKRRFFPRIAGTFPRIATHGEISREDIVIETVHSKCEYSTPVTGNQVAGMYPRVTTHGSVSSEVVLVETAQQQNRYMPPVTGDAIAGTYPSVAAHGDVADGGLLVGVSDGYAFYSVPVCGTLMVKRCFERR